MRFALLSVSILSLFLVATTCRGDEAAIRAPINEELSDYGTRLADVQDDIRDLFDQRPQRARNRGNLTEVDAISQSRLRFDTEKLIPKDFPDALRKRQESAVARVEKLYDAAQKAATRETLDYLAEQLGKEKAAFLAEVRPVLVLNQIEPSRVKAQNRWFSRDGQGMMGNKIGGVILFGGQDTRRRSWLTPPRTTIPKSSSRWTGPGRHSPRGWGFQALPTPRNTRRPGPRSPSKSSPTRRRCGGPTPLATSTSFSHAGSTCRRTPRSWCCVATAVRIPHSHGRPGWNPV